MDEVTIYHNPACGTSRNTLGLIRNAGIEPQVIEYLRTPPDRATLLSLIAAMGVPVWLQTPTGTSQSVMPQSSPTPLNCSASIACC